MFVLQVRGCSSALSGTSLLLRVYSLGHPHHSILEHFHSTLQEFVLACVYGAAGISRIAEPIVESHALKVDSFRRIELRPSDSNGLHMLFTPDETKEAVQTWATANEFTVEDSVYDYLHTATDGHSGMIGSILHHFNAHFPQLSGADRHARFWSRSLCHELLVEHEGMHTVLNLLKNIFLIRNRIAYRRLFPGPDPHIGSKYLSLRQTYLNAVQRFSPSALRPRSRQNPARWGIPEAAFQDEMYCCLNHELQNLPILSEYSPSNDGRVDFYVYEKKWGIELLQCGNKTEVSEHIGRFTTGGRYHKWDVFEDYIILNFCSKSTLKKIDIKGITYPAVEEPLLTQNNFVRDRCPVTYCTDCN